MRPSFVARSPFFAADARPLTLNHSEAFSASPSASTKAFLQSIMPAPAFCCAVAAGRGDGVAVSTLQCGRQRRRAASASSLKAPFSCISGTGSGPEAFRSALTSLAAMVAACSTVAGLEGQEARKPLQVAARQTSFW